MADIVLRDRSGAQIQYPGVERLKLNTADGGTAEFVDAGSIPVEIENSPITLDFSGGDQVVTAPEGYVVKSAIIEKPANLIPGNIAEGVDIAGIVGTLAAGGKEIKTTTVKFPGSSVVSGANTIPHDLGVIPDIIFYNLGVNASNKIISAIGFSAAFIAASGIPFGIVYYYKGTTTYSSTPGAIEKSNTSIGFHDATDAQFVIGNDTCGLNESFTHTFYLVAGLT